jgi:hypothetical protein
VTILAIIPFTGRRFFNDLQIHSYLNSNNFVVEDFTHTFWLSWIGLCQPAVCDWLAVWQTASTRSLASSFTFVHTVKPAHVLKYEHKVQYTTRSQQRLVRNCLFALNYVSIRGLAKVHIQRTQNFTTTVAIAASHLLSSQFIALTTHMAKPVINYSKYTILLLTAKSLTEEIKTSNRYRQNIGIINNLHWFSTIFE